MSDKSGKVKSFFKRIGAFLKKHALVMMVVSLCLCLLSGLFASMVQTDGFSVKIITESRTLSLVEVSGTLKFEYQIYKPKTATKDNRAPLVVCCHGYMNNKEMQAPIAMELARRGFVVIALDYASHGHTAVTTALPAFTTSGGVVALVEYGSTLEYVDATRIGLTGHSLGGDNSSVAARFYGDRGRAAAAAYYESKGVTAETASEQQKREARAADDAANKIRAVLPHASRPQTTAGTKTVSGAVVTYYDETTWGNEGKYTGLNAKIPDTDKSRRNKFQYEWRGVDYLSTPAAATFIKSLYGDFPTYARNTVPLEGQRDYDPSLPVPADNRVINIPEQPVKPYTYYTANGEAAVQPTAENPMTEGARVLLPVNLPHAAAFYNLKSIGYITDFFYASLGAPQAASKVLSSGNQTWVIKELFNLMGLVGIILFVVAFAGIALKLPVFAKIKERKVVQADGTVAFKPFTRESLDEGLPELKGWKRHVPFWLTLLASTLISGFTLRWFTSASYGWGNNLFPSSSWFPQAFTNGVFVWALLTGLISLALFTLQWLFFGRRLKDKPFEKLSASRHVGRSIIAAVFILAVAYIILLINEAIFGTDFRWYIVAFKTFDVNIIMTIIRYFLLFSVFWIINTLLNANQRFKNLPEWASTLITAFFNVFGLVLVYIIQYGTAYSNGGLYWWRDIAGNMINYSPLIIMLPLASVLQRRLYLKSGNVWFAGFVTSLLLTMMMVGNTYNYAYVFI